MLANSQFGTLVSESGIGCTWYGNSQSNRITPWSNDPLIDPIVDAIDIRDGRRARSCLDANPAPIRELDAYRVTHGQGYTRFEHSYAIGQDLCVFVPVNDEGGLPLRIQRLRLENHSPHRRQLTATAYSEFVLGTDKEETQMHVVTEWDAESQAIFAYNRYHADYGQHLAFTSSIIAATSFTADRAEFIGRNQSTSSPKHLREKDYLDM